MGGKIERLTGDRFVGDCKVADKYRKRTEMQYPKAPKVWLYREYPKEYALVNRKAQMWIDRQNAIRDTLRRHGMTRRQRKKDLRQRAEIQRPRERIPYKFDWISTKTNV